jgi:protein-S-isoprenylcysteine O-methyltransferase Ste14
MATMNVSHLDRLRDTSTEYWKLFRRTKFYDFLAASPLIAWYGLCVEHQVPALAKQWSEQDLASADLVFYVSVFSKLMTLIFIAALGILLIIRCTPIAKSEGWYPRLAALIGANLGVGMVLLPAHELSVPLYVVSILLVAGGTLFALYSALRLGRSISMFPEARRLVTAGPYATIRHPLYLGEAITLMGLMLQYFSPLALAFFVLQSAFQIQRMNSEEKVLSGTFPEYPDYMARTSRLVPGLY